MELNSLNQMGTVATVEHGKADGIEDQARERERDRDRKQYKDNNGTEH